MIVSDESTIGFKREGNGVFSIQARMIWLMQELKEKIFLKFQVLGVFMSLCQRHKGGKKKA